MCYRETLTFLTCGHKLKTTSYCPCFLRHEHHTFGPIAQRREIHIRHNITLDFNKCRYLDTDNFVVVALCPECNEEVRVKYVSGGSGRDWRGYELGRDYKEYDLGRDAFYTGEGSDGKGRGLVRRNRGNGVLVKRRIRGVTWQFDSEFEKC
jgi:hypothetical protein